MNNDSGNKLVDVDMDETAVVIFFLWIIYQGQEQLWPVINYTNQSLIKGTF